MGDQPSFSPKVGVLLRNRQAENAPNHFEKEPLNLKHEKCLIKLKIQTRTKKCKK
jgi:hypothetical protein